MSFPLYRLPDEDPESSKSNGKAEPPGACERRPLTPGELRAMSIGGRIVLFFVVLIPVAIFAGLGLLVWYLIRGGQLW